MSESFERLRVALVGTCGIPNRYGGFESFLENFAPALVRFVGSVTVTRDSTYYEHHNHSTFHGVYLEDIRIPANGFLSPVHDLVAFYKVFKNNNRIVFFGVSAGVLFPLFRVLCEIFGKRLIVNVDGVEWRRKKYGPVARALLFISDRLAQRSSHVVVYDNRALELFLVKGALKKAIEIRYPGDYVYRNRFTEISPRTALTICRIEPENNIDLIIEGVLRTETTRYVIVGNWSHSSYSSQVYARHCANPRLVLLNPIYEREALGRLRESAHMYIHGHSVGGTNPSLVEALFYNSFLLCFDVSFNRATVGDCATFFQCPESLAGCIAEIYSGRISSNKAQREALRRQYSTQSIVDDYLKVLA